MLPVAQQVGAPRIVVGARIPHPCGDPSRPPEGERALRRRLVETALRALQTPVERPTIFSAGD
jgi:glycine reductase complex component B subunit gamma